MTSASLEQTFAAWLEPDSTAKPPLLMVGAGLSAGLVPMADAFALEVAGRKPDVEAALGVSSGPTFDNADGLYAWADRLEACLDAVGMRRYAGAQPGMANDGWMTRYHVWFNAGQPESATDCQPLFKSHGCIRALHEGNGDFVIAKSEMDKSLHEQNSDRRNELRRQIDLPGGTISIGWKATEKYVVELFESHKPPGQLALKGDLTVIDLDPSQDGHQRIASSYPTAPHRSVIVNPQSPGTADDLMLWIQTVRGLRTMKTQLPTDRQWALDRLESDLPAYTDAGLRSAWVVSFFDDWLPVWLRNCCLAGAQLFSWQACSGATFRSTRCAYPLVHFDDAVVGT